MPCCGLIAFLFGQPLLLWNAIRSWLFGGVAFREAFQLRAPWNLGMAGGVLLAELALFAVGAGLSVETRQLDARLTEAAILPIGKLCSVFAHAGK